MIKFRVMNQCHNLRMKNPKNNAIEKEYSICSNGRFGQDDLQNDKLIGSDWTFRPKVLHNNEVDSFDESLGQKVSQNDESDKPKSTI